MTKNPTFPQPEPAIRDARDWVKTLSHYRDPDLRRSLFELAATLVPFVALWALAWAALSVSYGLAVLVACVNAPFLVRLFAIQHDCGHGAFFKSRILNDWLGRVLGVLTLTPYDYWRHAHSVHHSTSGNLTRRGTGDIVTLTVSEYRARGFMGRLLYRAYRNPLVLFVLGPAYMFFMQHRIPLGQMNKTHFWGTVMATNVGIFAVLALVYAAGGWAPIFLIFVPTSLLASMLGVWLFYVQHQFEETHWSQDEDWQLHDAALHGSSYYVLPPVLQWLTANIGIHHVHHLYSRIPFYRLPEVLSDHEQLAESNRLTIRESIATARLHLWDEASNRLMSFGEVRAQMRAA